MKRITLTLFALVVFIAAYCGTPQAISYQAVVQNSAGQALTGRDVTLRLSIIANSPTGAVDYVETQSTTTDGIGVAAINIGTGTVLSGSFSGINWATGTYFLKTEIDTNGGSNFATVGTAQFYSVPFALHASTADQANLGSLDFPDGMNYVTPVALNGSFSYTVPAGMTLYVTDLAHNGSTTCANYGLNIKGVYISSYVTGGSQGGFGTSNTITSTNPYSMNFPFAVPSGTDINSTSCGSSLVGFVVPSNYTWVAYDLSTGAYTVPAGKVLVVKNMIPSTSATWGGLYSIGGNQTRFTQHVNFIDQNTSISATGLSGSLLMVGFLKNR